MARAESAALCDGYRADLDLAPGTRGGPAHLHCRRRREMAAEVGGPHTVEIVLLVHVGQEARRGDEVSERRPRRLERLLEVLHAEHGLLLHRGRQVEFVLAMRVAVIDG